MDHGQLSMVADKFQWVFAESLLNACGKDAKFCRRERIITPFRLGLALTATCASQRVETLADFHRGFNALWDTSITYKAFYNQVAKTHFADFARTMTERLIGKMTLKVRLVVAHRLVAGRAFIGHDIGQPLHEQERRTMRKQLLDLLHIQRTVRVGSVHHGFFLSRFTKFETATISRTHCLTGLAGIPP